MFEPSSLVIFITATLALLLTPGPVVLYVVGLSIKQGSLAGFVSILGVGLASMLHVIFAALGLSAILMKSALVFSMIKYLGAAYLIYLGLRTLLGKAPVVKVRTTKELGYRQIYFQGFVVNILNPKTALFFLSFLPQFVDPTRGPAVIQILILGLIFISMSVVSDSMYALLAGSISQILSENLRLAQTQKHLTGFIYIGLGITAALSSSNHTK